MRLTELWAVRMPDETTKDASQIVEHHDDMSTLSLYGEHLSSPHDKIHSVWTKDKEAFAAAESLIEARRLKAKGCDELLDELIDECNRIRDEHSGECESSDYDHRQWSDAHSQGAIDTTDAIIAKLKSLRG